MSLLIAFSSSLSIPTPFYEHHHDEHFKSQVEPSPLPFETESNVPVLLNKLVELLNKQIGHDMKNSFELQEPEYFVVQGTELELEV